MRKRKKKRKGILRIIREFETYDRIYYDGKLTSLILLILCFLIMFCLGLAIILS
jgi:hypothetical protein